MPFSYSKTKSLVETHWNESIIDELSKFIEIPCKSPCFDPDWQKNGYLDQAIHHMINWCDRQEIKGLTRHVEKMEGRSPLLFIEIEGQEHMADRDVFFYGHLDKQPEATGWDSNKGPWTPVIENDRLYGRGGADDGYAFYATISAIQAIQQQQVPHGRCVIIIESGEEGGSVDLPHYFTALADKIGQPELVICLDADCGNYDQLWITTSLRGIAVGELSVQTLTEGVHSGLGSGVVASSARILRQLLDRIEDAATGKILVDDLWAEIPDIRKKQAARAAEVIGECLITDLPLAGQTRPVTENKTELILNRSWRPALSIIGAAGFPPSSDAGNVLRPFSTFKLSFRLPPTVDHVKANEAIKQLLEAKPPYEATVSYTMLPGAQGWNANESVKWFQEAAASASHACFGKDAVYIGEGGSIPFISLLNQSFPDAQFLITGLLGPNSNAHGPNEFLELTTAKNLTSCVAGIIAAHSEQRAS